MKPVHTPYDGSVSSFTIGLKPLDMQNWIEVDERLTEYLAEKKRLLTAIPEKVWAGDFSSEKAQSEVLELLVEYLLQTFPQIYSREGRCIKISGVEDVVDLDDISKPPLMLAGLLVQEDLVLMRKSPQGWRLVAASVCFPSSWILREKIGQVMHDIHAPVPGFGAGTRNATMIERIFDNLLVDQPVERFNWSVYNDDALFHDDRFGEHFISHESDRTEYYLRIEHQTLRKLEKSGDVLFTIRIHIDPIEALAERPDRKQLAKSFVETLSALDGDELKYKGLDLHREELIERLMAVTQNA